MNAPGLGPDESWSNHVITRKMTSELSTEWAVECLETHDVDRPCYDPAHGEDFCWLRDTPHAVIDLEVAYAVEDVLVLDDGSLLLFPGEVAELDCSVEPLPDGFDGKELL